MNFIQEPNVVLKDALFCNGTKKKKLTLDELYSKETNVILKDDIIWNAQIRFRKKRRKSLRWFDVN